MAYRSSVYKTIQRGSISIAAAATTNTATLGTAVDPNYTVVLWCGNTGDSGGVSLGTETPQLTLTNATTITAAIGVAAVTDAIVTPFQTREYWPNEMRQAIQRGTITMATGDTTKTATITAVGSKAYIEWSGFIETSTQAYSASTPNKIYIDVVLTNSTTITLARRTSGTYSFTFVYQVVDPK